MRAGYPLILSAAIVVAVAVPAHAQMNIMAPNIKYKTQDEVDEAVKRDSDYKDTMRKLPDQKASNDPWGSVRSGTPAAAEQKPKKKKTQASQ